MQRCTICNTNINNEEDVIFPLSKKNIPGFIWAHYSCILDIVGNLKDGAFLLSLIFIFIPNFFPIYVWRQTKNRINICEM